MINLENFPKYKISKDQKFIVNITNALISKNQRIIFPKKSLILPYSFNKWIAKPGKFFEMIFFGLNYNAKRIRHFRKPWVLDLQKSHKILLPESWESKVKTKVFKRRVLFFSMDRLQVTVLVNLMKKLRKQNSYSGHGLILRKDKYITKPGKIRQK